MIDTIQINKFSHLHNHNNIIFCKTDYLIEEFDAIRKLNSEVVLVSGNSDFVIDEVIYEKKPDNVIKWYAQNAMFTNEILKPLPIGIENNLPAVRDGHGVGWGHRVQLKEDCINNQKEKTPTKFIYANFQISTNPAHRNIVKNFCESIQHIDWEAPNLSLTDFMFKIKDYEAIICPIGNGPDTHRFYEVLYMNRIPIVFEKVTYEILHKYYPCVFVEELSILNDYETMKTKIEIEKNKSWDKNMLYSQYWIDLIKSNSF